MGKFKFRYSTHISFSNPVEKHFYTLRVVPFDNERQHIETFDIRLEGEKTETKDSYGNTMIIGSILEPHTDFSFSVSGIANVDSDSYEVDDKCLDIYKYPTKLTTMNFKMNELYKSICNDSDFIHRGTYQKILYINHKIHSIMKYVPGVTNIQTTAAEAFAGKAGVCQDFTHVMLAFLRKFQYPARYVVGLMAGEGETHAYVEVWIDGRWYGFDPTNDKEVDEGYIGLAHGRDYKSCAVSTGHFLGLVEQFQKVEVKVEEI